METLLNNAALKAGVSIERAQRLVWIGAFPLSAVLIAAFAPSMQTSVIMAVTGSALMMVCAAAAVHSDSFAASRMKVAALAPVLAAVMIWLAAHVGNAAGFSSPGATAFASALALLGLYLVETVISSAALLAAARGRAAPGASVAILLEGKFAGLFGRIS